MDISNESDKHGRQSYACFLVLRRKAVLRPSSSEIVPWY